MGKRRSKKKTADQKTMSATTAVQRIQSATISLAKASDAVVVAFDNELVRKARVIQTVNQEIDKSKVKYLQLLSAVLFLPAGGLTLLAHIIKKDLSLISLALWIIQLLCYIGYLVLKFWTPLSMTDERNLWKKGQLSFVFDNAGSLAFLMFCILEYRKSREFSLALLLTIFFFSVSFAIIIAISKQPSRLTNISLTKFGDYCAFSGFLCFMGGWFLYWYPINLLVAYLIIISFLISTVMLILTFALPNQRYSLNYIQSVTMGIISPVSISISLASLREAVNDKILGLKTIQPLIDQGRWMALSAINKEILEHLPQKHTLLSRIFAFVIWMVGILIALNKDLILSILEPILQQSFTQTFASLLCKGLRIACGFRM